MLKDASQSFARRARLSSKAIVTAVALTLAAFAAIMIASHRHQQTSIEDVEPVSKLSVGSGSVLIPVVDR